MADAVRAQDIDTVLVTGAGGYIGTTLVPMLLDAGYRVRALAASSSAATSCPGTTPSRSSKTAAA